MFLVAQPLEEVATVPITVIVNWPRLLKRSRRAMKNHISIKLERTGFPAAGILSLVGMFPDDWRQGC